MTAGDVAHLDDKAKRFVLRRRLGEGAFGVVWEAYDRERSARVALKTLIHTEPGSLLLFKREFRALADIVHPNLVTLYELLSSGDRWFFTMEFVDGVDFLNHATNHLVVAGAHVLTNERAAPHQSLRAPRVLAADRTVQSHRNGGALAGDWYNEPTMLDTPNEVDEAEDEDSDPTMQVLLPTEGPVSLGSMRFDPDRVRSALRQLAAGINTLHEAGKLHRDIKPSNVLVTREGRVVILDFGLITEVSLGGAVASNNPIVGTPMFMSPEQGLGKPLSPATDWYSVGVMLYAAMTGHVPFDGPPMHVLMSKAEVDPVPPGRIVPGLPDDLESLCVALLHRDPEQRPTGREIIRRLGASDARTISTPGSSPFVKRAHPFVGREEQLNALARGLETARKGRLGAALVRGSSGMGKSALVRHFLDELKERSPETVVLSGRCYQRESVPYKALDSLVDELSVYLQELPPAEASALMPRGIEALARLFPVLRQIEAVARPHAQATPIADPHELRRRAFEAMRELFSRLARRHPLVLFIDDLQWGDAESDALLAELVRPPNPPELLLIACYRAEETRSSPLMRALEAARAEGAPIDVCEVFVGELRPEEAQTLAVTLLGPEAEARAKAITRECGGNPFFIDALARHAQVEDDERQRSSRRSSSPGELPREPRIRLSEVIAARVAKLPSGARRLLETVVVAGQPIDVALARRAAGVDSHEQAVLSLLQVSHLVRTRADSPGEKIEIYHDRIRESVLAGISPDDLKAYHNRLAITLELGGRADPELLAAHYQTAERPTKALFYAIKAAEQAFDALAFDRAARLYALALSFNPPDEAAVRSIKTRRGESLANAGRGAEAADAYLAAAEGTAPTEALELKRRAAEQLLLSGHVDRGIELVRMVLEPLGMKLAETSKGAMVSLAAQRARLWFRGLRFTERSEREIPADQLMRIDTCWAIAAGLSLVDNIRGSDFQARHLVLALQAGEPYRIARALAMEVVFRAAQGGAKNRERADELVREMTVLAERIRHPHALALATTITGVAAYLGGQWRTALASLERGAVLLREQCSGVAWELDTVDIFILSTLHRLGRWKDLGIKVQEVIRGAIARGDLYAAVHGWLDVGWNAYLAADMPEETLTRLNEVVGKLSHQEGFQMQHFLHLLGTAHTLLYMGEATRAWELVNGRWPEIRRSFVVLVPMAYMDYLDLRSRCAIACAALEGVDEARRRALLKIAAGDVQRMEEEQAAWASALAIVPRAGVALTRGDVDQARALILDAEAAFDELHMEVHRAVAQRRRGELLGGEEGRRLIAGADKALAAQGIKVPKRIAGMIAPGRWVREHSQNGQRLAR